MATYVKCSCQHCNKHIEFDSDLLAAAGHSEGGTLGPTAPCPHCGMDTILHIPPPSKRVANNALPTNKAEAEALKRGLEKQALAEREDFLKTLRAETNYAALRNLISIIYSIFIVITVILPLIAAILVTVTIVSGLFLADERLAAGVPLVVTLVLAAAFWYCIALAARQAMLLLIDLADSSLKSTRAILQSQRA